MSRYKEIWNPKSLVVVFVEITPSGKLYFAAKNRINSDKKVTPEQFDDLEAIVKAFGSSMAYQIHLLGSGVLSRKIDSTTAFKEELILNGDPDDFVFSTYSDGNQQVVSFTRKSSIAEELALIESKKWHFLGLSCGIAVIFGILEDEKVTFDYELELRNGTIKEFNRATVVKEKAQFRSEFYTEKELLSFAIVNTPKNDEHYSSHSNLNFADAQENYRQFNQFKTYGILAIGSIFIALLSVYFYQNHLNQSVAELEVDLSVHNENLSLLDRLTQEKERKGQLIASAGVNSKKFLSYYLDEIGKSVPKEITLSELALFPVQGKLKNKQRVELDQERITILGVTRDNEILDDWMEKMNRFDWIIRVELLNYLKGADNLAEFELIIIIE